MERFFAFLLICILSPLFVVVALLIKIDSPGPVIFKQKRVGQYGNYFTIYKFRTMKIDTPDLPSDKIDKNDERFTRIGKILRRFSIDEIPQLFNIIKGDMSFIGPRPALYNQVELINLRKKEGIFALKPGITGWAQVNGRDNISIKEKVELDKFYLQHKSLLLDLKIIFLTFVNVITGSGLYSEKATSLNKASEEKKSISF